MSGESYCPECGAVFTGLPHQCTPKILLTNEGIETTIRKEFPIFELNEEDERDRKETINALLEAQLKKVVGWIEREYPPASEQHPAIIEFLYKFRQALLEEINHNI